MVLTMKDLWDPLQEDRPPAEFEELLQVWLRDKQKALAVIHLHCEREQKLFIAEADTGKEAWDLGRAESIGQCHYHQQMLNTWQLLKQLAKYAGS